MAIGISGSGGSAGGAASGGGPLQNSGEIVFSNANASTGVASGMSLLGWLAIAAVAGIGAFFVTKKLKH
jgi:hypothetical protein